MNRPRAGAGRLAPLAIVLACVIVSLWTHRRVLGGFFSLDDLVVLAELQGIRDHVVRWWRFLSLEAYLRIALAAFGTHPFPYHLVSWLLHGVNVVLVYLLANRAGADRASAALAAGLFGTTRLTMTAIHSPATMGDPASLGFMLGVFLVRGEGLGPALRRAGLFVTAVLCKESVIALPLLLLLPLPESGSLTVRWRRARLTLATAAIIALALLGSLASGSFLAGGEAYAIDRGSGWLASLASYVGWTGDLRAPIPELAAAATNRPWLLALFPLVMALVIAILAWRATKLPAFGVLWWLAAIAPVVPLAGHVYPHYLYAPCAGAAFFVSGVVGWIRAWIVKRVEAQGPSSHGRVIGHVFTGLVVVIVAAHAARSDRLLAARHQLRLPGSGILLDPYLRKSETARTACVAVAKRLAGRPGRVAFLVPSGTERSYDVGTGRLTTGEARMQPSYRLIEGSLDQGRALRAIVPGVDSVAFLSGWQPGFGDFELFAQSPDGAIFPLGRGADGFATAAEGMLINGARDAADRMIAQALGEFPDHAGLRYQSARVRGLEGDSLGMRRELEELIRRSPNDPLVPRARAALRGDLSI